MRRIAIVPPLSVVAGAVSMVLALPCQAAGPLSYHTLTPCRVADTRPSNFLANGEVRPFTVHGVCGVPSTAKAVALNVTAVSPTGEGHLTLFASGTSVPTVSTVNFPAGVSALANGAIVSLSTDATNDLSVAAVVAGGGTVHVVLDASGYFE